MNASIMHKTFGNDEFFTLKLYTLHDSYMIGIYAFN